MIVRPRAPSASSLLALSFLFLANHAASSVTLSQFQEIQGFSSSCESVWQEAIPGCTKQDFSSSDDKNNGTCSRSCLAGVNIINAEVLVACSDARVDSNTLLGEFLAGYGVFALCGGEETGSQTMGSSTTTTSVVVESTSPGAVSTTTSLISSTHFSSETTTTAIRSTSTTKSAQPSPLSTTAPSATSTSTSTSTSRPNLTIAFSASSSSSSSSTTTTATTTATRSTSSATTSSDPEAKGFGGVGNAFDILGGESGAAQTEIRSLGVATFIAVGAFIIFRGVW